MNDVEVEHSSDCKERGRRGRGRRKGGLREGGSASLRGMGMPSGNGSALRVNNTTLAALNVT